MDYTRTPSANKAPGPANFEFLELMYGNVNGGGTDNGNGGKENGNGGKENGNGGKENDNGGKENGNNGNKGQRFLRTLSGPCPTSRPAALVQEMRQAIQQFELRTDGLEHLDGWLEEHRSEFGSLHSRDFGNGYKIQVSKLLVAPDEL